MISGARTWIITVAQRLLAMTIGARRSLVMMDCENGYNMFDIKIYEGHTLLAASWSQKATLVNLDVFVANGCGLMYLLYYLMKAHLHYC